MMRLASTLYSMIATALAGTAVVAVLVAGASSAIAIAGAAAVGALVAMPVSWVIAKKLY